MEGVDVILSALNCKLMSAANGLFGLCGEVVKGRHGNFEDKIESLISKCLMSNV